MANSEKVTYASLFDFSNPSEVDQAIKKVASLDAVYESLELQVNKAKESVSKANKALADSLKSVTLETVKDVKAIEQQNAQLQALTATYEAQKKEISTLTGQIQKLSKERTAVAKKSQDINNINTKAIALEAQIGKLTGENARETAALKLQKSQLTKQLALEAKEAAGLVGIYDKQVAKLNRLTKEYKNVATAEGVASKNAVRLSKDLNLLRDKMLKVENAAGQGHRTIGQYGNAIMTTGKQFLAAFGVLGGVTIIANLVKDTFNLIKETERYNKALKQVTSSSEEYASELDFLKTISNRYGINLNNLTDSYTKFFAATKGTNLEGQQTRKIFDAVSKSAAVMSLTTEDTEGALKALGQMISKGKVQAEELRGQLGDRLPGAFRIMADALGVTTSELDKMLEQGELMAEEVLPKFATQLEIAFGLKSVNSIETLSAAQVRLTNAWISFVKQVEDGEGAIADFIITAIGGVTKLLNYFSQDDSDIASKFISKNGVNSIERFNSLMELVDGNLDEQQKRVRELARSYVVANEALTIYNKANEDGFKTIDDFKNVQEEYINKYGEEKDNIDILNDVHELYAQRLKKDKEAIDEVVKTQDKLTKSIKEAKDSNIDDDSLLKEQEAIFDYISRRESRFDEHYKKQQDDFKKASEEEVDILIAKLNEQERLEKEHADKVALIKKTAIETSFQAADIIGNQLFTNQQIRSDNELKNFENQKNFELEIAGDNAQQRAQIEADFARKERDIRLKQAKAAKKQALFNVTIQTAQAVVNALATLPYPAAPIAAAAAGVVGAAQSIAVLSEPLPAFEKGGVVGGNSPIITSEKGYEYAVKPDGKLIKTGSNGAEVRTDIPKGSVVLNHAISKQLDQGGFNHREINDDSSFKISKVLLEQRDRQTQILAHTILKGDNMVADAIEDTIKRMPMPEWNITDGKLKKYIKKANTRRNAYESQIRH